MALNKRALQKLIDNPAMFSAEDLAMDEENVDEELGEDVIVPEPEEEADMLAAEPMEAADFSEIMDEEEVPQPEDAIELEDDEITKQELQAQRLSLENPNLSSMNRLQKLREASQLGPDSEDDMSDEDSTEIAKDIEAPVDLRKRALQKIKQKYLGT